MIRRNALSLSEAVCAAAIGAVLATVAGAFIGQLAGWLAA